MGLVLEIEMRVDSATIDARSHRFTLTVALSDAGIKVPKGHGIVAGMRRCC